MSPSALRALSKHPNHRIADSARRVIVDQFMSIPAAMRNLRAEGLHPSPVRSSNARRGLKFLRDWVDNADTDFDDDSFEGPFTPRSDLWEMADDMLRRRPLRSPGAEAIDGRLTSLATELELGVGGAMDYERLIGNARATAAAVSQRSNGGHDGHLQNARQLGVENFAGLNTSRRTTEQAPTTGITRVLSEPREIGYANPQPSASRTAPMIHGPPGTSRGARREAYVMQGGHYREYRGREWWEG